MTCPTCGAVKRVPSNYECWRDRLDLKPTREQDAACRYLQERGKRFLVDFGIDNAADMVWNMLEMEAAGVPIQ